MSENVLMRFKSEKSWKNPLRVWLKFVNTCSKVYSLQNYVGILTWEKPYKFQLYQRTFSRDNFRYVRKHFMHFVWNTWMNLKWRETILCQLYKKHFRDLRVYRETKVSTRNYLKYLTLLTFTNNNWWTKKKMEVWGYSIYDDTHEWIHAY